jgi:Rod binding domain-containing protein
MSANAVTKAGLPAPATTHGAPAERAARLTKAAHEFEAIFVGYMLKAMRSTVARDGEQEQGFGGPMLEGLFDMQLAGTLTAGGHLGIGEALAERLQHAGTPVPAPQDALPAPRPALRRMPALEPPAQNAPAGLASPAVGAGVSERLHRYAGLIEESAARHGVDSNVVRAVIAAESGGRADARSPKNAKGLMQLTDSTAADMGVRRIWDPRENIEGGVKYLKRLLNRFDGDLKLALASYNAGPGAVERHGGVPPFRETRAYVDKVTRMINALTASQGDVHERD